MYSSQDTEAWRTSTGFDPVQGPTHDDLTPAFIDVSFSSADGTSHGQHLGADPIDYAYYNLDYDLHPHDFPAPYTLSDLFATPDDVDTSFTFTTQPRPVPPSLTLSPFPSEAELAAGLSYSGEPSPQDDISPVSINVVGPGDTEPSIRIDYDHMRWPTGRGPSQRRSFGGAERQRPTIENLYGRPRAASAAVLPSAYAVSMPTSPAHLTVSTNGSFTQSSPSPTHLSPGTWGWRSPASPYMGSDPSSPSSTTSSHPSSPFIDGVAHSFEDESTGSPAAADFVGDGEQSLIFRPPSAENYLTGDAEHVEYGEVFDLNLDELTEVNLKSFDDKLRLDNSRAATVGGQQSEMHAHSAQTSEWASNVAPFDGPTLPAENHAASAGCVNPAHTFLQTHPTPQPPPDAMGRYRHFDAPTAAQDLHLPTRNTHHPVRGSHQPGHSRFLSVDVATASLAQVTGPSSAPSSSWSHRSSQSLDVGTPSGYLSVETHAYSTPIAGSSRGRSMTAGVQKRRTASRRGRSHSPYLPARPLDQGVSQDLEGGLQPSSSYTSITFVEQEAAVVPRADGVVKLVLSSQAGVQAARKRRTDPEKRGRFICEICGSDLTAKHNLQNHVNAHLNVKPHRCNKCEMAFTTVQVLKRHDRVCTGTSETTSQAS